MVVLIWRSLTFQFSIINHSLMEMIFRWPPRPCWAPALPWVARARCKSAPGKWQHIIIMIIINIIIIIIMMCSPQGWSGHWSDASRAPPPCTLSPHTRCCSSDSASQWISPMMSLTRMTMMTMTKMMFTWDTRLQAVVTHFLMNVCSWAHWRMEG